MLHVGTLRGPFETIVNSMHPGFRVSSAIPWHPSGAPWGAEGCTYSHLGGFLGLPGDSLGCPREPSGALLGALGASPGSPGTPCGVPWDSPGTPWVLPADSPGLPGTPWVLPVNPPGTPRDSLGLPVDSPGSPRTPRGPLGLSRDSLGTPWVSPGTPRGSQVVRFRRVKVPAGRPLRWTRAWAGWVQVGHLCIAHRSLGRSGRGGYIGSPTSMDMKCPHKIGRESWEWGMSKACDVQRSLLPKGGTH